MTAKFDNVNTGGYYCGSAGQALIQNCDGGQNNSTNLSGWLAQTYPNLFGSNAGCDNLLGQEQQRGRALLPDLGGPVRL